MPAGPKLLHLLLLMYPTPPMIRFLNFTNHPFDKGRYCALSRRAEMKHLMKIGPKGENAILELNAEC
jgi:hypothetical protein